MKYSKELTATAYHEAGHAAVQLWFQHPFLYVTILPTEEAAGLLMVFFNKRVEQILEYDAPYASEERYIKHELIILSAGGVAEAKFKNRQKVPSGATGDYHQMVKICSKLGMSDKTLVKYIDYIEEETKDLMNDENIWNYVQKVAGTLLERKTLKYSECRKIYKDVIGTLFFNKGSKTIDQRPIGWYEALKENKG